MTTLIDQSPVPPPNPDAPSFRNCWPYATGSIGIWVWGHRPRPAVLPAALPPTSAITPWIVSTALLPLALDVIVHPWFGAPFRPAAPRVRGIAAHDGSGCS